MSESRRGILERSAMGANVMRRPRAAGHGKRDAVLEQHAARATRRDILEWRVGGGGGGMRNEWWNPRRSWAGKMRGGTLERPDLTTRGILKRPNMGNEMQSPRGAG